MRYVLYARKSGESEDRQIQSIPDQVRLLRELAQRQGFSIVSELTESKSAKEEGTRPVFQQMLALIKRGEVDAILCWSVNRLSRNPEDSGRLAGLLQRGELRAIQTFDRRFLPQDNTLLFAVEASVANEYILELRRNTQRGTNSKVEQGWFPHRAPEGYVNDSLKLRGQRTISSDPLRFPLLRQAFERLLTGQYSVAQVHRLLTNEWGYTPRSRHARPSGPLPLSTFHRMVQSPFYAGYFVHAGELHVGKHPPMLTLDEFQRLQAILKGDVPRRRTKRTFAFTGLIKCAHCGGWVTAEEKRKPSGRTYRYYHCHGQKCKRWHVREEVIEEVISSALEQASLEPEVAAYAREALGEWESSRQQEQEAIRAGQERAAGDIQERLTNRRAMKKVTKVAMQTTKYNSESTKLGEVGGYLRMSKIIYPQDCVAPAQKARFRDTMRQLRQSELKTDAARHGETITRWYDDLDVSGRGAFLSKRTAFEQARQDASQGVLRTLYARDLSRLFRDVVQQEQWFAEMEEWGVAVQAQDLPFAADAATRRLIRQQIGSIHEYMARRTGALVCLNARERVRNGLGVGSTRSRWGLRYDQAQKAYTLDSDTADKIRLVFETYVACEGVAAEAARQLNALLVTGHPRGTFSPRGRLWTGISLLQLVSRGVYRRRVCYMDVDRYSPERVPAVVDPALVARADALLAARNLGVEAKHVRQMLDPARYTYADLLHCGCCGAPLRPAHSGLAADAPVPPGFLTDAAARTRVAAAPSRFRSSSPGSTRSSRKDWPRPSRFTPRSSWPTGTSA